MTACTLMAPNVACTGAPRNYLAGNSVGLLEVGEHREDAAVVAGRLRQIELGQDALHVLLDRADREHERLRDAGVGASFRHQREYLALARGESLERPVLA